ncbi:MAG: hypothetical protein EHM47_17560, partial [Ignavibacteriales bacterium]
MIFNSRASKIAGINDDQFRGIYDVFVPVSYLNHLSEIYTNVTNAMDIPELPESEQEIRMNGNISGNNAALIFPLAGWKAKEWGINNFISLAKKIQNTFKVSFVMPEGSMRTDVINEICSEGLDVIKTKDVPGMINEIKKCSLVISNDSGPSHVAELLGKRVITLFGPTNPAVHKKKSDLTVNIMKIIKCS